MNKANGKPWRDALQCAPKKCPCGKRLKKPRYGHPWIGPGEFAKKYNFPDALSPVRGEQWYINCSCARTFVWSFHKESNGCWMVRSILPLFDSKEIVVIA